MRYLNVSIAIKNFACIAFSIFLLYSAFTFSQESLGLEGVVTRNIFSLIRQQRPILDTLSVATFSIFISFLFLIPFLVFAKYVSRAGYELSRKRVNLAIFFYLLFSLLPKSTLFLYNIEYAMYPMINFYASSLFVLLGAFIASALRQPFQDASLKPVFSHNIYFSSIGIIALFLYANFASNGFEGCGFNISKIYECRASFSSNQDRIVDISFLISSVFPPFLYLLSKKARYFYISSLKLLAFSSVYIMLFYYTGHKSILALAILVIVFKSAIVNITKRESGRSNDFLEEFRSGYAMQRPVFLALFAVTFIYAILLLLYFPYFVELRWIWALLMHRLTIVPSYLDFVYVSENIKGALPDFGTAALEAGKIITGEYGTWSNASFFGSSFVRGQLPRLLFESTFLGFLLYTFCTQKRTVLLEVLSFLGLLQCFIVLLSLDLQNALLDRGLFVISLLTFLAGSKKVSNTKKIY